MTGRKTMMLLGGTFFLLVGLAGFYRLMFGWEIWIGREHIGHVSSYLVFVVCVGLSIALFRASKGAP